jgi:predicted RNA binding protein YcfA (HicA-like mRNA interferase family)
MASLPQISGNRLVRALEKAGWTVLRQSGSHVQMKHPSRTGRLTVPLHGRRSIPPKTLAAILSQAGLGADELRNLL